MTGGVALMLLPRWCVRICFLLLDDDPLVVEDPPEWVEDAEDDE